ncbi:hypothetical protein L202_04858 [Cryptococcus amylolentus CBS 6039]|uniref:Uncharacterized protein n=1 Tax=Cryptococcus amylolentus CBS 6039 TaxID=1295533 RepID=A0A1E3HPT3_9TREE|nr:hypothetical protein L202_04858 [Cryptococcus amylolentus CBS 6039]ODN77716.1 hypothetical protein L202_04858 [Cryptococcus amylolentus CBS 6039]
MSIIQIPIHPPDQLAQYLGVSTSCIWSGSELEHELNAGWLAIRLTDEQSQSPLSSDGIWSTSMRNPETKQETIRYWQTIHKNCTDPQKGFFRRWGTVKSMLRHTEGGFTDWNPDDHASDWISLSANFDWIIYQIAYRLLHRGRPWVVMSIVRLPAGDDRSTLIIGEPVQEVMGKDGYLRNRRGSKYARRFDEKFAYRLIPKKYIEQSVLFTFKHTPLMLPAKHLRTDPPWNFQRGIDWVDQLAFNACLNRFYDVLSQICQRQNTLYRNKLYQNESYQNEPQKYSIPMRDISDEDSDDDYY